ncbi:MAG: bifunctional histidinol-phosphatase/imidazoleglycerol-phosphate dehydratase HisB [Odoribacteraceae bacterium]|jgi:imidazoleglycerol-phosphate dehydratase/histidinol-phosphatase|nr:bifunctional histidinol-phosphatase/imidazoleglycerol-phosphate dehydratase HisB [Odoribacteraceae bacterium]
MKKILFIDRDGTIIQEPPLDHQVDNLEKLRFVPGVITALAAIATQTDYRLVMVTNQDGLYTPDFPPEVFFLPHCRMLDTLSREGILFDEVLIDVSRPGDKSPYRKPATGMVEKYLDDRLDRENSYVIGDRLTDMKLAANMGIRGIYLGKENARGLPVVLDTGSWDEIRRFLVNGSRRATLSRVTSETSATVSINLNGTGSCKVVTGIAFFDHMLEQIARHAGIDLNVETRGDLSVDEHHTIEDTALLLGACLRETLGTGKGIERYGFVLPMDEARATVALDLGGRSYLEWDVELHREYVGDFPTEMTRHFFASLCQEARCTLHVEATGENTHHVIEAIFKGFARALKMAIRREGTGIPSSKGVI